MSILDASVLRLDLLDLLWLLRACLTGCVSHFLPVCLNKVYFLSQADSSAGRCRGWTETNSKPRVAPVSAVSSDPFRPDGF